MNAPTIPAFHIPFSFRKLACFVFWCGVCWLSLGSLITFIPGGEAAWFQIAGGLLLSGFLVPRWSYRAASLLLIACCLWAVVEGRHRGAIDRARLAPPSHVSPPPSSFQ